MAAPENNVETIIVRRIEERLASIKESQGEIPHQRLLGDQSRLFDGRGGNPDNTHFFPAAIRQNLNEKIKKAQDDIILIMPHEVYAQNNLQTATLNDPMKQQLLAQIENIFVDPQTGAVKQPYIDAFGGMETINSLFSGEGFKDVDGNEFPAEAPPLEKLKSFLINAYYNQYNHEFYIKAIALPNLAERLEADPALNIAILLWQGVPFSQVEQMYCVESGNHDILAGYNARRESIDHFTEMEKRNNFLGSAPETDPLESLLQESDDLHQQVLAQEPHFSSPSSPAFFAPPRRCDSATSIPPALGIENAAEADKGCTIS